jgi:hypothetical protein
MCYKTGHFYLLLINPKILIALEEVLWYVDFFLTLFSGPSLC